MKRYALFPLLSLALTACGGSGGESGETSTTPTPSAVEGKIQNVNGSTITVNNRPYQVAQMEYAGHNLSDETLEANMMVSLKTSSRATSANVQLDPTFTGKITDINGKSFKVNGVELQFDRLSNKILEGDWVMVSTLPTANAGYKVLSIIQFEYDADGMVEAEGRISNLNVNNNTFKVGNSLTVLFDSQLLQNGKLRNGAWVEVFGTYNEFEGELTAETLKLKSFSGVLGRGETEGVITWVANDQSRFELNYRGIFDIDPSTKFDDGSKADLRLGAEVEVEYVNQAKRTIAKEIEFEDDFDFDVDWDKFEFERKGIIENTNDVEQSFEVRGQKIFTDANTEFDDGLDFDFLEGEYVEVEGVIINGDYVAREIEREDD
ncbi:hypothetical protein GCE9029_02853 [Grimontia celer]|uniref:DUF5666 domain-containing protein n=1 Tax=Grimontia celer TaxID=1796497 RepID=A0A128F4V9_9GAMM|nr:DUF5666 domain-containing protein [Grimontia celer]CZF81827.1 hypothetical protein GCE9029_02853 [Grimontia celer]